MIGTPIRKAFSTDITIEEGERAVVAKISTIAVDRDGEVLIPQGCNSKDFEKNPVVFLQHDYWDLPVAKCVAIKRDDTSITTKTVFAMRPDDYPVGAEWMPDTLFSLFKQGVIKGFSVGFEPMESRPATDKDIERFGANCRRIYNRWKLLEYSVAPLPANQEALALAVSKTWKDKEKAEEEKDKQPLYGSKLTDAQANSREPGCGCPDPECPLHSKGKYLPAGMSLIPKRVVHYRRKAALVVKPSAAAAIARAIEKRKGFIYSRH